MNTMALNEDNVHQIIERNIGGISGVAVFK